MMLFLRPHDFLLALNCKLCFCLETVVSRAYQIRYTDWSRHESTSHYMMVKHYPKGGMVVSCDLRLIYWDPSYFWNGWNQIKIKMVHKHGKCYQTEHYPVHV